MAITIIDKQFGENAETECIDVKQVLKLPLQQFLDEGYSFQDVAGFGFEVEGIPVKAVPGYYEWHFIPEDVEFVYGETPTWDMALHIWQDSLRDTEWYIGDDDTIPDEITVADYVKAVNDYIADDFRQVEEGDIETTDDYYKWLFECYERVQIHKQEKETLGNRNNILLTE